LNTLYTKYNSFAIIYLIFIKKINLHTNAKEKRRILDVSLDGAIKKKYLLEVLQTRSAYKFITKRKFCQTKRPKTLFDLSIEIKQKNIGDPFSKGIIKYIKKSRSCQQKKSRSLDQFCVLLCLFFSSDLSLDF
jgi:hypothetical protein